MRVDRSLWVHVLVLLGVAAVAASAQAEPVAQRQRELVNMVRQDCGSCHGLTLKGGLGPALLPEDLRDKPAESLVATVMASAIGSRLITPSCSQRSRSSPSGSTTPCRCNRCGGPSGTWPDTWVWVWPSWVCVSDVSGPRPGGRSWRCVMGRSWHCPPPRFRVMGP